MSEPLKIYSWDRCPDCTRLKFVLNLKNIEYTEIIASNDALIAEVEQMLGKFCVPAMKLNDGTLIDDSIHTLQMLDNKLGDMVLKTQRHAELEQWNEDFTMIYRKIIAPFWIHLPIREFDNTDVLNKYIENVQNVTGQTIDDLINNKNQLINEALEQMQQLSEMIMDNANQNYLYSIDELNLIVRLYWLAHIPEVYQKMPKNVQKYIDHALLRSKMELVL